MSRPKTHAYRDDMRDFAIAQRIATGKTFYVRSVCGRVRTLPADMVPGAPLDKVTCLLCRAALTVEIEPDVAAAPVAFQSRVKRDPSWADPTAEAAIRRQEMRASARHETQRQRAVKEGETIGERAYIDWSKVTINCAHVDAGMPIYGVDPMELEGVKVRFAMCDPCYWAYSLGSPVPLTSGQTIHRVGD